MAISREGIAYLDGPRLSRGFKAGIHRVITDQERLNRINVFPVPDGDTGTNLAITMQSVLGALSRHQDRHAGRTLEVIADAALDGARGNSGAIIAQFFLGLGDACGHLRLITVEHFVAAVERGAQYARDALSEPREGTIISVLADFAGELRSQGGKTHDFLGLLERGLERSKRALAATTNQLEALRRAGVVDAGAQGFVDLLQGITDFARDGSAKEAPEIPAEFLSETAFEPVDSGDGDTHRFCTECVITASSIDRRALKEELAVLGSSLVLAGTARKLRVHIHLNHPEVLFETARRYGQVSRQKADDMRLQQRTARGNRPAVAVVVDTAGDITEEDLEKLGIFIVPIPIHFGNKGYLDKVTLTPDQFFAELENNPHHPKTSQPPPGDFRRLYQFLGSHHQGVISIHVSGKVSGTLQAAQSAAARSKDTGPVMVVDSRNASLGQGMIALYAAEMAAAGYALDEITLRLDEVIAKTRTYGLLNDLEYAVRGGRVPRYRKFIADVCRLNPVLTNFPDGSIAAGGFVFGRRRATEKFVRFIRERIEPSVTYRLGVGHARNPERAQRVLDRLLEEIPSVHSHFITEVGTALGAHGGPGTLVVALQEYIPIGQPLH
jgi:DegV family protein with EDD domain